MILDEKPVISRMVRSGVIGLSALLLLLSGCQATLEKPSEGVMPQRASLAPDWVQQLPQSSSSWYAIGRAQSNPSIQAARQAAQSESFNKLELASLAALRVYRSEFEQALRRSVQAQLPPVALSTPHVVNEYVDESTQQVFVLAKRDLAKQSTEALLKRLEHLDATLKNYIHMNDQVSGFEQLQRLMPALWVIEEIHQLQSIMALLPVTKPVLKNAMLFQLLDKRISLLASDLTFNTKALVREAKPYEPALVEALARNGLQLIARPPDFILDYHVDLIGQSQQGEGQRFHFAGDITLLDKFGLEIIAAQVSIDENAPSEAAAQQRVIERLAQTISQNLRALLIEKH